jgi:chemotaxis protein methyltransferase CheR
MSNNVSSEYAEPQATAVTELSAALSQKSFLRFADYITRELGIKMPDSKMTMVQSRLLRRARELRLESLDAYSDYFFASSSDEERQLLINVMTTNKTDFFRESEHFTYLQEVVLPELRRRSNSRPTRLNAWSAACSSGQEPYTLAMILNEYTLQNPGVDFAILGTDISTKVLEEAHIGIYHETLAKPIPAVLRAKYMLASKDRSSGLVRISAGLRSKVSFHQLNLMNDDYRIRDMFDIVFCRNVLIYFDRPTQESVIQKICRNINPGGYLFAGHSESLSGMDIPAVKVHTAVFRMPLDHGGVGEQ